MNQNSIISQLVDQFKWSLNQSLD